MMKKIYKIFLTAFFIVLYWGGAAKGEINLADEITVSERSDIAIPTRGLFDECDQIIIDLTQLDCTEWCFPLYQSKFLSPFGTRNGRLHSGVDLKPTICDTIRAAFTGRVRFSKHYHGYGSAIVVRHSSGIETLYSHNKKQLVKSGDYVKAGQPIAIAGRTGRATTVHLHFEVRLNGHPINPAILFNIDKHELLLKRFIAYKSGKLEIVNNE